MLLALNYCANLVPLSPTLLNSEKRKKSLLDKKKSFIASATRLPIEQRFSTDGSWKALVNNVKGCKSAPIDKY